MRILVTGGREYSDRQKLFAVLDEIHAKKPISVIIQGECLKGADLFAKQWARLAGVCCIGVEANWDAYNKKAGPIRNSWMLKHCTPIEAVLAFPGNKGTANMVSQALKAGIFVQEVK